jgi:hypothetical protein
MAGVVILPSSIILLSLNVYEISHGYPASSLQIFFRYHSRNLFLVNVTSFIEGF